MAGTIGVNFRIGAQLSGSVGSAFASLNEKLRASQQAFRNAERESKQLSEAAAARARRDDAARRASQQMRQTGHVDDSMRKELQRLNQEYANAARAAGVYGQSVAEITRRQREMARSVQQSQQRLQNLNAIQQTRNAMQAESQRRKEAVSGLMGTAMSAMAMAAPIKIGMDFEAAMSKVGAISRASEEDLAKMKAQARELGATTVWSAKEAAEGMTFLSMAGFKTNETLDAMPGLLNLASAAGQNLGSTSDIASNILTGFGFEAAQMGYVGDVLAKTFTKSNTDLQMLGESFKYCAPIAKTTGQSFQDVAAMIGKLGDAGIQGSMAGTSLNAMLVRMSSPPKEAATALAQLGIETRDAEGNLRKLPDLLREIGAKTSKMGTGVKAEYLAKLFGLEHVKSAAALAEKALSGELQEMSASLYEKGYATDVAKKQTDNLAGDLKALSSASQEVAICLYEAVSPALRQVTQSIIGIVQPVGTWIKANPELAQGILLVGGALVGLKTASVVFTVMSSGMKSFGLGVTQMGNHVRGAFGTVHSSFSNLRAQLSQPVSVSLAGAQANVQNFKSRLDSLRQSASQTIGRLRQLGPASIAAGAQAAASGAMAATGRAGFNMLRMGVRGVGMAFKMAFGPVSLLMMGLSLGVDYVMSHWDQIQPYFEALWEGVKNIFNSVLGWLKPIVEKITGFISPVIDGVKSIGSFIGKGVKAVFGGDKKEEEKKAEASVAVKPAAAQTAVKTQAQLQEEQQWADQYASKDFQVEKEKDEAHRKALQKADKEARKAAKKAEREANKKGRQPEKAPEVFDYKRGMEQMNAMPDNYGDNLNDNDTGDYTPAPKPATRKQRSKSAQPAAAPAPAEAAAPQTQIVQPQVQVSVNVTQNGVPDQTFAQGVINAIRSEGQAAIEEIVNRIVGDQARLAYGG